MRGDLQEGNGCASRCQYFLFPLPIPFFPSTKSGFLCSMTWSFEYWEPFLPFHGWCHRRIALLLTPTTARRQPRTPAASRRRPPGTTAWTDSIDRQYGPIELDRKDWNASQPPTASQRLPRPAASQRPPTANCQLPTSRRTITIRQTERPAA